MFGTPLSSRASGVRTVASPTRRVSLSTSDLAVSGIGSPAAAAAAPLDFFSMIEPLLASGEVVITESPLPALGNIMRSWVGDSTDAGIDQIVRLTSTNPAARRSYAGDMSALAVKLNDMAVKLSGFDAPRPAAISPVGLPLPLGIPPLGAVPLPAPPLGAVPFGMLLPPAACPVPNEHFAAYVRFTQSIAQFLKRPPRYLLNDDYMVHQCLADVDLRLVSGLVLGSINSLFMTAPMSEFKGVDVNGMTDDSRYGQEHQNGVAAFSSVIGQWMARNEPTQPRTVEKGRNATGLMFLEQLGNFIRTWSASRDGQMILR